MRLNIETELRTSTLPSSRTIQSSSFVIEEGIRSGARILSRPMPELGTKEYAALPKPIDFYQSIEEFTD